MQVALIPVGYPSSAELLFAINESQRKSHAEVLATDRFSRPIFNTSKS